MFERGLKDDFEEQLCRFQDSLYSLGLQISDNYSQASQSY